MDRFESDESGQIIVIAALLLAVLFVGLALVLNSAIYAENIATRGETSTAGTVSNDVITEERLQEMLATENYGIEDDEYSDRRARIETNITEWNRLMGVSKARNGRLYHVEPTAMTNGTRVNQTATGNFMPNDPRVLEDLMGETLDPFGITDRTSWLVAPDAHSRAFEMTVQSESLQTVDGGILDEISDLFNALLTGSDTFWVQYDDGNAVWRVYVVEIQGTDEVATIVTKDDGSEEVEGVCRIEGDPVTVRINAQELESNGTVVDCPALSFSDELERHDLFFAGADDVSGTYQFMVDKEEAKFRNEVEDEYRNLLNSILGGLNCVFRPWLCSPDIYGDSPNGDDLYTAKSIYDVSVETTYQDGKVSLTRNVTYPPSAR